MESRYRYAVEVLREDGSAVGQVPVQADWEPAVEWALFDAIRKEELPPVLSAARRLVEPIWSSRAGQPYVSGFKVILCGHQGGRSVRQIPIVYFQHAAEQQAADLVKQGKLAAGERFLYRVLAYPGESPAGQGPEVANSFTVEEVVDSLPLGERSLAGLLEASTPFGAPSTEDPPVFIPQQVLDEASTLTRGAGSLETGGILIGYLQRDPAGSELFVQVTAQIAVKHAHSQLTRLTFTPDTWAAVRAAVALRGAGELYLGWWHCHCFMKAICKDCKEYKDGSCGIAAPFMSAEDCALHRTVFPRAYSLALVISDAPTTGLTFALFGWKYGVIAPRGFHILGAPDHAVASVVPTDGGTKTCQDNAPA